MTGTAAALLHVEFEGGESVKIGVMPGEALLAAARRAGIIMASDCRQGQCKTCRCTITKGAVSYPDDVKATLTAAEIEQGAVLPCVARISGPTEIQAPYSRASMLPVKVKAVQISAVHRLSESVIKLSCKLGAATKIDFMPGQYVRIQIPGTDQERSYSMATAQKDWPQFDFLVRLLPGGVMSEFLQHAVPGEKIQIKGPFGAFYLRESPGPMLMVAGGTGLAPMLSILSTLHHRGDFQRRVVLCFGATNPDDLASAAEIEPLRQKFRNLELRLAVVNPSPGWDGIKGNAVDLIRSEDAVALKNEGAAYLCGPAGMIASARDRLTTLGVESKFIYAEEFVPSPT